ncbi:hypothetical protein [Sorangium sp. So ce1024]|uniref:hypothetical protein n=1 Tax=Sorangium sp. So ce1024 TaxID=3133327 RepID=UPI003EFD3CB5
MSAPVRRWLAAALVACSAGAVVPAGCSGTTGQLMFAFKTDMSLPKDIDAVRILVTLAGTVVHDETHLRLGSEEGIRLPATLGFYTPDDPTQVLHLRVIATQGGEENVRLLSQVVTTVPEDRTAVLDVPLQLLCYGRDQVERDEQGEIKRDAVGSPQSTCGEGKTCVAGTCRTSEIPSADLPDYVVAKVFGGGTGFGDGHCFDTVRCFEREAPRLSIRLDLDAFELSGSGGSGGASGGSGGAFDGSGGSAADPPCWVVPDEAAPDREDIQALLGRGDINLALLTQGGGICSASECYAPLDAESEAGWWVPEPGEGRIRVPSAVCNKVASGELRGVAAVRVSKDEDVGACQKKSSSLPTCGRWSASGQGTFTIPDDDVPMPIALGLAHPVALLVTANGVYWTETGTFQTEGDESGQPTGDGAVKWVPLGGGNPLVLADRLWAPRDLAARERVDAAEEETAPELVFWTMPGKGVADGEIWIAAPELGKAGGIQLVAGLERPQGIALDNGALYWTEEASDGVFRATTTGTGLALEAGTAVPLTGAGTGSELAFESPYRVAAAAGVVCWVYQGQLDPPTEGAVACQRQGGEVRVIAASQRLPRALRLHRATGGSLQLYWASYDAEGAIFWVDLGAPDSPEPVEYVPVPVATGQPFPGGIAVDDEHLYWTNQLEGTVMRARRPAAPGDAVEAEPLARDQRRPGAIEVEDDFLYWINEGSPGPQERDGAIMRLGLTR